MGRAREGIGYSLSLYLSEAEQRTPAGIRTPDTLLKRQVLCLLSYWGAALPDGLARLPKSKALAPFDLERKEEPADAQIGSLSFSGVSPAERVTAERGGTNETIRSFRAIRCGLRGSGASAVCSDVAGMAGLEPTISESKSGVLPLHYIPVSV